MVDMKFIKGKGLIACRDLKEGEKCTMSIVDYLLWKSSEFYEIKNIKK